jgi:hypothetical protein
MIDVATEVPESAGIRKAAVDIKAGDWVAIGSTVSLVTRTLPAKRGPMSYLQFGATMPPDFYSLLPGERVLVVDFGDLVGVEQTRTEARVLRDGKTVAIRSGMTVGHAVRDAQEYIDQLGAFGVGRVGVYTIQTRKVITRTRAGEWHDA